MGYFFGQFWGQLCVVSPACRQADMAAQCVTKVELTVSCDHLLDKDIGSKSDPLCVLLMNTGQSQWYEVSTLDLEFF